MSRTVVPRSTAISSPRAMARSWRFRPRPKASRSIGGISANCLIWRIWVWQRSSRLSETPSVPGPRADRSSDELGPKLQERRSQAIHGRPGPDAEPHVFLQPGFAWGVDADSPLREPINEVLARHNRDPAGDERPPRRKRLQERQPAQESIQPRPFIAN